MRQIVEMAHPMYETICKALRSTSDMLYIKNNTLSQSKVMIVL